MGKNPTDRAKPGTKQSVLVEGDGGAVDFRRVREVLDGEGFTGPYTIEIEGIQGEPEPGLEGRVDRVARSVEHLRKCGYFD